MTQYEKPLGVSATPIPGLTIWDLPVYGDNRGWFKENWQREKMIGAGLPDFQPIQNNVSFNDAIGTTRGIHAEPWDKFVSVATGRIFGAWIDLRAGPSYGSVFTAEIDPSRGVFVPRGVGNAFQTLQRNTTYIYLVNDHYSPETRYTSVNLADASVGIEWPIPLEQAELSEKDRNSPMLRDTSPIMPQKVLVIGADGQLGRALRDHYKEDHSVEFAGRSQLDLTRSDLASARRWRDYQVVINAAAYTAVDSAESALGRAAAWAINVNAVSELVRLAAENTFTLVHISSDYVFDGSQEDPYVEHDALSPLGVYGQTKAAADLIVSTISHHYIVRTSWVIGDGKNFVRSMHTLAESGVNPAVVDDQRGRLTFTSDIVRAIQYLLQHHAPFGTYNVTGSGPVLSWADVARQVFTMSRHDPARVTNITSEDYRKSKQGPLACRPPNSTLDLTRILQLGFQPSSNYSNLQNYISLLDSPDRSPE